MLWSLTHISLQHSWLSKWICVIVCSYNCCHVYNHKIHVCLHLETNETNGWWSNCKNCYNSSNSYEPTFPSSRMVTITGSRNNSSKFFIYAMQVSLALKVDYCDQLLTNVIKFASGLYWNSARTNLCQRTFFNISLHRFVVHSCYNWINDCNKKETSHWKRYQSTRSKKSG